MKTTKEKSKKKKEFEEGKKKTRKEKKLERGGGKERKEGWMFL